MAKFSIFAKESPLTAPDGGPLTQEHHAQIGEARLRSSQILRAARVAHRQMIGLIVMGVPSVMLAFMGGFSLTGFIMGAWMTAAGIMEGIGEGRIRRLNPQIFNTLYKNQLALGAMFIVISSWWMLELHFGAEGKQISQQSTGLSQLLGGAGAGTSSVVTSIVPLIAYAAYGTVFLGGLIECGLTALYYRVRGRQMQQYLSDTPDWIVHLHRTGSI